MKRSALILVLALRAAAAQASVADVVTQEPSPTNDPLFAPQGRLSASLATGVPYLGIGEVAYGITDRVTAGVVGGVTPTTEGVGIRLRGNIADWGSARLMATAPVLYYPATKGLGDEPWLLAMPSILAELRIQNGARVHAGFGVAAASCIDTLHAFVTGKLGTEKTSFMGDVWATATIGGSIPLGASTSAFADVSLVSQGLAFQRTWIGGPPTVVTIGAQHTF